MRDYCMYCEFPLPVVTKIKKEKSMTESEIQIELVKYLTKLKQDNLIIKFTKIPNETHTTSWQAKTKNIVEGLRGGLCDLFIISNKHCFFLELKTLKGKLSENQISWIKAINDSNNGLAFIAYGLDEAKKIINDNINFI